MPQLEQHGPLPWDDSEFTIALIAVLVQRLGGTVRVGQGHFTAIAGTRLSETGFADGSFELSTVPAKRDGH